MIALLFALSVAVAQAPATPPPTAEALAGAARRFEHEPSVDQVVGWTLDGSTADPSAAGDALDRARWSALLPQVRVGVRRGLGWDWAARQSTSTDTSSLASGEDLSFVGTLIFRLDRLLAPSEETGLLRERTRLEATRFELASQVIALYFERRRLQIEGALGAAVDVAAQMRIAELTALLDVLTRGRFSEALE